MSLAGTLLILVAMFTDRWLHRDLLTDKLTAENVGNTFNSVLESVKDAVEDGSNIRNIADSVTKSSIGLFEDCKRPDGAFFEGECIPNLGDLENFQKIYIDWDGKVYPHAWRGAILCFSLGLIVCVLTDLFALLTICCRRCICCSVFTVCGSLQSFASILFTLGLIAYAAGWGSDKIAKKYCGTNSYPFVLGDNCSLDIAFWLAVAGTVCTVLASSLAIWAYQSTRSQKAEQLQDQGDRCICLA